ncbi:peptidase domain-containing ABC transporter [Priestia megaterium]|uniref:peptidase domain-containing ABC transporter n=1 Tax=Priestia megaterium TaxID=1404 RepID=UPI00077D756C|nr:peptidase domain-containing ABC transporter [Priestia megaterium]
MSHKTKRKVPFVEQMQQTECGLCCVVMILRYYKSYESISEIRNYLEVGRDGVKISQIYNLLEYWGFSTKVYKTSLEGLKMIKLPSIIYWKNNHFVVLEKVKGDKFYIVDPALGKRIISEEEMSSNFSNAVIVTEPTESFLPKRKEKTTFTMLLPDILSNKYLLIKLFIISLVISTVTLAIPIVMQRLIDEVSLNRNIDIPMVFLFLFLLCIYSVFSFARGKFLIDVKIILNKSLFGKVFSHLLKLPYKFFEVRSSGDILFRMGNLDLIKDLISEKVIKGILEIISLVYMISYMFYKSPMLTIVVTGLFLVYGIFTFFIKTPLKEANLYELMERSKLERTQVETITAMFAIKVAGIEEQIFESWNKTLENVLYRYRRQGYLINIYTTFTQILQTTSPFIVLIFGLYLFTNGIITIGEVIAFYSIAVMFFTTSTSLFQTWNDFWLASNSLERIKDITDVEVERDLGKGVTPNLSGDIELRNVSFSYSGDSEPVLQDVSLHIKSGQKVAIVGASGSGKSTLGKLLLGLYPPNKGDIFYDSINFEDINKKELRRQMGTVPQDIHLFNKSIYENISMGIGNVSLEEVRRAAHMAQIDKEIEAMPMNYQTLVSSMGMNLSGGQRQRIALARALINNSKAIILDEATSALDSANEAKIANFFKSVGCTCIIIAHRLSTVIDADVIYVVDKGKIVEFGNHQELISLEGKYYNLYKNSEKNNEELAYL